MPHDRIETSSNHPRGRATRRPVDPTLSRVLVVLGVLGLHLIGAATAMASASKDVFQGVLGWPEDQRLFVQDGPQLLLSPDQWRELFDLDTVGRDAWIAAYLGHDPIPETPQNELVVGIEKRRAFVLEAIPSFQDERARVLFLHGPPDKRQIVDCAEAFKPMEMWTYKADQPGERILVFYQPSAGKPFRLWFPLENKSALYTEEMAYFLEQWEELKSRIRARKRIDRFFCEDSERIDKVTGVDGLYGFRPGRPKDSDLLIWLDPPTDLAAWAKSAAAMEEVEANRIESPAKLTVLFPEKQGQRMVTRLQIEIEDPSSLGIFEDGEARIARVVLDGHLERYGYFFEDFRVRFQIPYPDEGFETSIGLHADLPLRPGQRFLLRARLVDEITQKELRFSRGLEIDSQITPIEEVPVPDEAIVAIDDNLAQQRIGGFDSLVLIPPSSDVIFGLWRAEALVTGNRIERVKFFLDGQQVMSRKGPPFSAELRLANTPREQVVRVEGYDAKKELVASDEVIINQPRGELRVRILEPKRGTQGTGLMKVSAEVVVPEEKRVSKVEIKVNEEVRQTLHQPPWETEVDIPWAGGELTYISVGAELDDGLRAEDVRFVNAPDYLEEVDVNLVELYTTVSDRNGQIVQGLERESFRVFEDGKPQEISKFELVENLPLSLGIAIDVSGSMAESLGVAQRSAVGFLESVITPRDRCFALAFSDRPEILMPRTSDVGAIAERLNGLVADGATALHDAVVTSLYYYRGIRGRRALVLLSDGEDTASSLGFREALEYAKRSGIAIYAIGLRISKTDFGVRNKLDALSTETGGRAFYIREAVELQSVYAQIERELRSQYLLAYNSSSTKAKDQYRQIELKVDGGKLEARTIRGYYP